MTQAGTASSTLYFEQFYLGCLSHASYLLGSDGEAVVVDPQRDVEIYLEAAQRQGLQIKHIFETHLHADFVSGHKELAARTGAKIYIGAAAGAKFDHVPLTDGMEVPFGRAKIKVFETPGHTLESICLVVTDEERSAQPWAVLTGDTLFIGDVGRPDLSPTHTPRELAGLLYDSLHEKLMKLPDEVVVYPAHGAGSLCGRNMRAERSSTIGTERLTNYALQIPNRDEFIKQLTTNLPARPEYFLKDAEINREGAVALGDLPEVPQLSANEVKALMEQGVPALDVRAPEKFAAGHIPGSINIALSGQFATWAGTLLGVAAKPILLADSDEQISEARVRLARVGIDAEPGHLSECTEKWTIAGYLLATVQQISVHDLREKQDQDNLQVVDVRREAEWKSGHIKGSELCPLDKFAKQIPWLPDHVPTMVHCKSGYRSMIACSLLQKAGYPNVVNVVGGFDAWAEAKYPSVAESA
jgi:glyoxylase-like metal-dependent hydrolase (beta-lactamase superfamily II)/rhodanese-related sulfurtransferase